MAKLARMSAGEIAAGTGVVAVVFVVAFLILGAILPVVWPWLLGAIGAGVGFLVWVGLRDWLHDMFATASMEPAVPVAVAPAAPRVSAPAEPPAAQPVQVPAAPQRPAPDPVFVAPVAPEPMPAATPVATTPPVAATGGGPRKLFEAPAGPADDLKLIKGVGPALERTLNLIGITTWRQVAALTTEQIAAVEGEVGFRGRVARDGWLDQAKVLASGGVEEYRRVFGKEPR